jgi:GAF domain-containing protein
LSILAVDAAGSKRVAILNPSPFTLARVSTIISSITCGRFSARILIVPLALGDVGVDQHETAARHRVVADFDHPSIWPRSLIGSGLTCLLDEPPDMLSTASIMGRAILMRASAQIVDIFDDPEYGPKALGAWARSTVAVPLLRAGTAIGAIGLGRSLPGEFAAAQMELLQTFAEQAVIAISSAETYRALQTRTADLQESLEYQTATSDVLKVISRSIFDLQHMLEMLVETAARLCEADQAVIIRREGESAWLAANYGFPPEYEVAAKALGVFPLDRNSPTVAHRTLIEDRPVHIHDVAAVPGYPDYAIRLGKQRTSMGVPLSREGEVIGVIVLARQRVEPFNARQIELVSTFADQAVIAIENTRLLTEQREALEQQTATAQVLQVINASPGNLQPVFDAIVEKAHSLCDAAYGSLQLWDGAKFYGVVMRGFDGPMVERLRQGYSPYPSMPCRRLVEGERVAHCVDLAEIDDPMARSGVALGGVRTILYVALRKDDALLGQIVAARQEVRPFSQKEISLVESFAAQAVIAMENARLLTEQHEALEQQTATAEVLQVINAAPGDLVPVFDAILEKAHTLCGAGVGALFTYDGTYFRALATRGFPERHTSVIRRPFRPTAYNQPLISGERYIQVPDMSAIELKDDDEVVGSTARTNLGTGLGVPLRKDGTLLGYISAFRQEVRLFSEKEITLLENFAAQAVIAMENARLLNQIRQRQEELRVTFENMGDGVAMFDETQHLVAWNRKFQDILDVPGDIIARRQTFTEYVQYLADRGEYAPEADPEEHVRRLIEQAGQARTYERTRPDGRVIEIRHNPVASGGFVLIYADITERKRNEAEIRAARDAAEEASRTIEAAYRELKAAQANLIQAEKMASLGQLTAGIAHEIKMSVDLLAELKETAAPGFVALTDEQRADIDDVSAMLTSNLEKITEHGKRADGIG